MWEEVRGKILICCREIRRLANSGQRMKHIHTVSHSVIWHSHLSHHSQTVRFWLKNTFKRLRRDAFSINHDHREAEHTRPPDGKWSFLGCGFFAVEFHWNLIASSNGLRVRDFFGRSIHSLPRRGRSSDFRLSVRLFPRTTSYWFLRMGTASGCVRGIHVDTYSKQLRCWFSQLLRECPLSPNKKIRFCFGCWCTSCGIRCEQKIKVSETNQDANIMLIYINLIFNII